MWVKVLLDGSIRSTAKLNEIESIYNRSGDVTIWQNAKFAKCTGDLNNFQTIIYAYEHRNQIIAYAVTDVGSNLYKWSIGRMTLLRRRIMRVRISGGIVGSQDQFFQDHGIDLARELLQILGDHFGSLPILLQSAPIGSAFDQLITLKSHRGFWLIPNARRMWRYGITIPSNFEEYVSQISRETRRSLKRSRRSLNEVCQDIDLVTYSNPDEVEEFVDIAIEISKRTYQYKLGLGLQDKHILMRDLHEYAEKGWFRGHILRCGHNDVAYYLGYQVGSVYSGISLGYLPSWARHSVGSISIVELIKLLVTDNSGPTYFDFGVGDWKYKNRLGNFSYEEQSFFFLRKGLKSFFVLISMKLLKSLRYMSDVYDWAARRAGGNMEKSMKKVFRYLLALQKQLG